MKEHLLNDGDRAALQALVPLAGALGVGTTFALFFGGQRKSGTAVFELFAIVAVLAAAGSTAFFAISLLHQNEAITSHDLTQTATPLVVAAFLLVFVSVFARLPGSGLRLFALVPLALAGIAIAALLASATWSAEPENASLAALVILAVGVALAGGAWAFEQLDIGWGRRSEQRRLTRLYSAGYLPNERALNVALPRRDEVRDGETLICWARKGRSYLDMTGWHRLRREVGERWGALASGEAQAPSGAAVLVHVKVGLRVPLFQRDEVVRVSILEPAKGAGARVHELRPNDDGLFDVTELGVV